MKKNKFLRISKYKKLRYIANNYKKNLYIVFLPGFASDIDGDKPKKFLNFSIKNKLGFLALEYFGHGRSSGEFTKGRGITPVGYAENCPNIHFDILENIKRHNNKVRLEDLFSGQYFIIFKKRNKKNSLNSNKFKIEEKKFNFRYRPKSWLGKKIRKLGIHLSEKKT